MVVAASSAISRIDWVSVPAMCGLRTTLGSPRSGLPGSGGSWLSTSRPAPARWPETRASRRSVSTISPPRDVLIEVRARAHLRQEFAVDHAARGFGQRQVQADDVRGRQQLVERQPVDAVPLVELGVEKRVKRDDAHPERQGAEGHRPADPAHADQAQGLAPDRSRPGRGPSHPNG